MIVLLRHGRTAVNAQKRLQGRLDVPLDDHGRTQAAQLAATVATTTEGVAEVRSSPLLRCLQTAQVVADTLGVPVVEDERWVELDYGKLDGTPLASVPAEVWQAWQQDVDWHPEGGESLADVGLRTQQACLELAETVGRPAEDAAADAVVVSHVSPIKAAVAWALGTGQEVGWRTFLQPASITRINVDGAAPRLQSFNETSHLA